MSAERIVALDVSEVLVITDWFVIASAPNVRRVRRIAELVEERVKAAGGGASAGPLRVEGLDDAQWVLMDFGEFVMHVFHEPTRDYYDLERLWSDVPRIEFDPAGSSAERTGPGAESR